jgi:hypothetical protein
MGAAHAPAVYDRSMGGVPDVAAEDLLLVSFGEDTRTVNPGRALSFGRDADLVIDAENPYLHRVLGVFVHLDGVWWLQNVGRSISLVIADPAGVARGEIPSGQQAAMVQRELDVRFVAGRCHYELACRLAADLPLRVEAAPATDTIQFGAVELNSEQRLLVVAMAEPLLRCDPAWPASMPPNREVARRLGWTLTKFNRKLDYLCGRLSDAGVSGLQGGMTEHASNRRLRLVEHLVDVGAISAADLALLDGGASAP